MRISPRALLAGSVLLAACSSTVLETRHGSHRRSLAGERTLVVADVAAEFRRATEDAVVRALPGALPAYAMPGSPTSETLNLIPSQWDAVVVLSVAGAHLKFTPALATAAGSAVVTLELDVSVRSPGDFKEVWGERIRRTETFSNVLETEEDATTKRFIASSLAPAAAAEAAKRLAKPPS